MIKRLQIAGKNGYRRREFQKNAFLYLMALPAVLYLFINNYMPLVGLVVAFKNYTFKGGIFGSQWVGLANFKYLFSTSSAWVITRNTIGYNLLFIVVNTVGSVILAILLNEIRSRRMLKAIQTAILMPYLLSTVVISYLVYAFLSAQTGYINGSILKAMGLPPVSWYSETKYWPFILSFVNFWKNFGFLTIIYYASIISIDESYYEAAEIDGATRFQQIIKITIPLMKQVIIMMVLMNIGRIFFSDFGLFYQVPQDSGMLYSVTNTIDTYVYRALMQMNDVSMASAAGLYQSVVGFVLVMVCNAVVRKIDPESSLF